MSKKLPIFPLFRTTGGRQVLSLFASKIFERSGIKGFFGAQLVAAVFVAGIITPEANNYINQLSVEQKTNSTPISVNISTLTTFEKPLTSYAISQNFSFWHPGTDMTAPLGTPIYAIEAGIVEFADSSFLGYGKHVIISHDEQIKSLYGHLSEILTEPGRKITRGEMIGKVGSTGFSSGNHLHLEIYYNGVAINPLEVLPIKNEEITYDGSYFAKTQTVTTSPTPSEIPTISTN